MAPTFILANSPYLLSQVTLASFVPDVSQPHQDAKRPCKVSESEYSIQPDEDLQSLVTTKSGSLLEIIATKFAGLLIRREKGNDFRIEAEEGRIYSLDSPADLFSAIIGSEEHGDKVKRWLEEWKINGLVPRFVVGYRTFVNGRLALGQSKSRNTGANVGAPISTALGDPMGLADSGFQVANNREKNARINMGAPGERIYAIQYRKIKVSFVKGVVKATLDRKNKWEPFAGMRGDFTDVEDMHLEAYMSDIDDEDCDVFVLDSATNEARVGLRLGLLYDYDSEEDDSVGTAD